jgi:hypothetical protein
MAKGIKMDAKNMEASYLYPQAYEEPTKPSVVDHQAILEANRAVYRAILIPYVTEHGPTAKDVLVRLLGAKAAPGSTTAWGLAIEELDREWHPDKFKVTEVGNVEPK